MRKALERARSKRKPKKTPRMNEAAQKRRALARRAIETLTRSYFLRCLDALPAKHAKILADEMTPILQKLFKTKAPWHQILEKELQLKPGTPQTVKAMFATQP